MNFTKKVLIGLLFSPALAFSNNVINDLNEKSSCDSTCTKEIEIQESKMMSNQEFLECPIGYVGKISKLSFAYDNFLKTNETQNNCECKPQTYTEKLDCPANTRGEMERERQWSCS